MECYEDYITPSIVGMFYPHWGRFGCFTMLNQFSRPRRKAPAPQPSLPGCARLSLPGKPAGSEASSTVPPQARLPGRCAGEDASNHGRAIAAIGGIERFVKPGYNVVIKPNICSANYGPEYAATTNRMLSPLLSGCASVQVQNGSE